MRVSVIVAVSENGVIGRDDGMPWHLPSDLKHFKAVTMGAPVIMGRKTFQSIGRALPGRTNIVITRNRDFKAEGVTCVGSLDEALAAAKSGAAEEVFIIGGGEIYRQALPSVTRIHLTRVHMEVEGDTLFPAIGADEWREVSNIRYPAGAKDTADFSFIVLERTGA